MYSKRLKIAKENVDKSKQHRFIDRVQGEEMSLLIEVVFKQNFNPIRKFTQQRSVLEQTRGAKSLYNSKTLDIDKEDEDDNKKAPLAHSGRIRISKIDSYDISSQQLGDDSPSSSHKSGSNKLSLGKIKS